MTLAEKVTKFQDLIHRLTMDPATPEAKWLDVERQLTVFLNENPDEIMAILLVGFFYCRIGKGGLAISLIKRAQSMGADGAGMYLNMAGMYRTVGKEKEAEEMYRKAIDLAKVESQPNKDGINEDLVYALHGMGAMHINAGRPHQAIYWCDEALKVDPEDKSAEWNKGLALLESGCFKEGFEIYDRVGFKMASYGPMERKLKTYGGLPRWNGEKGKTVITYGEQGVGDEIMFISMLPDLMRDCKVIVDCDPRIEKMIKRSFPDLEAVYPTSEWNAPFEWTKNHKIDGYVPMGSLGKYYRNDAKDFPKVPYLKADETLVEKWGEILKPYAGMRVGISWAGGTPKTNFNHRSMPLERLSPILKTKGVDFFSLQYHKNMAADESAEIGNRLGVPIHHWQDMISDYEETAAFLMNLDLVITVNTSLHHLCGALGVQQWVLCPKRIAWRYGTRGPSPWYGNCLMMRQHEDGDWDSVIGKAAGMLADRASKKEAA